MTSAVRRIVSLVPSTTASVCAIGAAGLLVGRTRYCVEPADEVAPIAVVGGTKNPDREQIVALAPDLWLANAEENRAEDLEWLGARVPVLVQTPSTVVEAARDLRALARRLDRYEALAPYLLRIEAQLAASAVDNLGLPPLCVCYVVWRKPWMSINRTTFVHDLLRCVGAENVCAGEAARYPEFDPAQLAARGTRVVLLASEPWAFDRAQCDELIAAGTFGGAKVALCDGRDFCWHGTHMADGIGQAAALLAGLRGSVDR